MARVTVTETLELADRAAQRLAALIAASIAARGSAFVCLTGGSTPQASYEALADSSRPWRGSVDWSRVHLGWGDERHVPPDHADSNFGMADRSLIRHVPIPASQVHRMRGEIDDPHDAAAAYDAELRAAFAAAGRDTQTFDVMLLGLGEDAHVASIFPGSELLAPDRPPSRTAAVFVPHLHSWRITLNPGAILDSDAIVMLVSGAAKRPAVDVALNAPADVMRYPVHLLREASGRVEWMIDRDAAPNGYS